MAANRARLLQTLADEGLLRANAAHALPMVPLRIGLVTSGGSAAYHDFVQELEASCLRVPGRVERSARAGRGGRSPDCVRVAAALRRSISTSWCVVRGGGSRADLAVFDTEVVARADRGDAVPGDHRHRARGRPHRRRRSRALLRQDAYRRGRDARRPGRGVRRHSHVSHGSRRARRCVGSRAQPVAPRDVSCGTVRQRRPAAAPAPSVAARRAGTRATRSARPAAARRDAVDAPRPHGARADGRVAPRCAARCPTPTDSVEAPVPRSIRSGCSNAATRSRVTTTDGWCARSADVDTRWHAGHRGGRRHDHEPGRA